MADTNVDYIDFWGQWQEAKARGLTQTEHAKEINMRWSTYKNRMNQCRAMPDLQSIPESRYPKWNDGPKVEGDVLILGDLHIPIHHAAHVNRCIKVAKQYKIKTVILAGDVLDVHALSRWPDDIERDRKQVISQQAEDELLLLAEKLPPKYAALLRSQLVEMTRQPGDLGEEIKESRRVIRLLADNFDETIWFMGNHEKRLIGKLEKTLPANEFAMLFGADNPKFKMSAYYFCDLISGGVPWRITHPKNSGKSSSKKLVPIHNKNIVMLHNHAFSIQSDPSGKWLAIEPGMCCDPERVDYEAQRDSTHDAHVIGACAIVGGKPLLINEWWG